MKNLNIEGHLASSSLMAGLSATKVNVYLLDNSVHVEGGAEQEAAAVAFAASFDIAAGVFADAAKRYEVAVQAHLDSTAKTAGYDNILSACSYAGFANPFQVEGQKYVAWRGMVWEYCYEQLALVQSGARTAPTVNELIADLPALA